MKKFLVLGLIVSVAGSLVSVIRAQDQKPPEDTAEMAAMMAKAQKVMQPGEHHKALERFIGKWDTETRFFMGGQPTPPEKGTTETSWLMEGRWIQLKSKGTLMGMPFESLMIMGYDNFKKSYVTSFVSSFDTAMVCSEGDMNRDGTALLTYGTLDDYTTGELDKMVKSVWRFESEDKIVWEFHDLPIGETNTKVMDITSTRQK